MSEPLQRAPSQNPQRQRELDGLGCGVLSGRRRIGLELVDIARIKINFAAPWLRIRVSECATHSL